MKIKKSALVYTLFINIPICVSLSIASNLSANGYIDWINVLINLAFAYPIAIVIGLVIPFVRIGKWFTGLFGVRNDTYTKNILYRLLAVFISAVIYFILLNPLVTIFNVMILGKGTFLETIKSWIKNIPLMLVVGYISSLIFDIFAYKIAHKIDPEF